MAEYIEREEFKEVLTRYLNAPHVQTGHSVGQGMRIAIKSCIELLDNEYAADVAPVRHGRWMPAVYVGDCCYRCSECQFLRDAYLINIGNYCPNCGAKMDEPERELEDEG